MKQLFLTLLCKFCVLVSIQVNAQSLQKSTGEEQWPPLIVLRAAEQAVDNSTEFPLGTYDYYYFVFVFSKGLWKAYVEHYLYNAQPSSYLGIEIFYFKNSGKQVLDVKKDL